MDTQEFSNNLSEQIERSKAVLVKKADEYATTDRMHNFKKAAHLQGISPRAALAGMMAKHTVSVYDMLMTDELFTEEQWNEKIGDHVNYLFLARALVEEDGMAVPQTGSIAEFADRFIQMSTAGNINQDAMDAIRKEQPSFSDVLSGAQRFFRNEAETLKGEYITLPIQFKQANDCISALGNLQVALADSATGQLSVAAVFQSLGISGIDEGDKRRGWTSLAGASVSGNPEEQYTISVPKPIPLERTED